MGFAEFLATLIDNGKTIGCCSDIYIFSQARAQAAPAPNAVISFIGCGGFACGALKSNLQGNFGSIRKAIALLACMVKVANRALSWFVLCVTSFREMLDGAFRRKAFSRLEGIFSIFRRSSDKK